jgi:tryptophan synthase alpha chain
MSMYIVYIQKENMIIATINNNINTIDNNTIDNNTTDNNMLYINRIDIRLQQLKAQGRKALIPFITCGDPSAAITVQLMHALATAGADVIELGVPFSDPMADGPVIQKASERALNAGMTLRGVLAVVTQYRQQGGILPVVLMGYANPIERMGIEIFSKAAQQSGVDGVLIVDYPPEEAVEQAAIFKAYGLAPIFLISPTTSTARIQSIAATASGYIYYVSIKGITGAANLDVPAVSDKLQLIRQYTQLPLGVGFGISTPDIAADVAKVADAVVIGSKLIQLYAQSPEGQGVQVVQDFIATIRAAIDAP